ncbi:MAG: hypothetical protein HZB23_00645 [Deltaproteobacteria bacterium]|nr:hypothetical protein [Deltaproteobacteria bacterium]
MPETMDNFFGLRQRDGAKGLKRNREIRKGGFGIQSSDYLVSGFMREIFWLQKKLHGNVDKFGNSP